MSSSAGDARRVQLTRRFTELYGQPPTMVVRAPGRVNLIGEHTDYNEGFVLPAAIDRAAWIVARARDDRRLRLFAAHYTAQAELDLDTLAPDAVSGWAAYGAGMADYLQRAGHALRGADMLIDGDVPEGAGLSSSAALEVATGAMLMALAGLELDRVGIARVGQLTEHNYVHVNSGIMDQLISAIGRQHHALLIDCRSYHAEAIPLRADAQLIVCNSKVARTLAGSGYNTRRAECDEAVRILSDILPGIKTLRDVTVEQLTEHGGLLPPNVLKRARHVVTENARVLESAEALKRGNLQRFGELMNDAHRSYRDDFEASLHEIEVLVTTAQRLPGVYGSRLTGGGWGGCTVSLVDAGAVDHFCQHVAEVYEREVGYAPDIYVCAAAEGVAAIALPDTSI